MAFKRISHEHRRIQLISLIDLIFILLIFFIITSIMIKLTQGEAKLYIPTPKNEPGEAQILIQILAEDSFLWIDHTAIDTLNRHSYRLSDPLSPEMKVNLLLDKMTFDNSGLEKKVEELKRLAHDRPDKDYFVMIRCPDEQPYFYATNIIEKLVDTPNLEYGCVAGSIDELRHSSRFTIAGNVLQIDL